MQLDYRWDNDPIFPREVFAHPECGPLLIKAGIRFTDPENQVPAFFCPRTLYAILSIPTSLRDVFYQAEFSFVPHSALLPNDVLAARAQWVIGAFQPLMHNNAPMDKDALRAEIGHIRAHARDALLRHATPQTPLVPNLETAAPYTEPTPIPLDLGRALTSLIVGEPTPLAQAAPHVPALHTQIRLLALLNGLCQDPLKDIQARNPLLLQHADILRNDGGIFLTLGFESDTFTLQTSAKSHRVGDPLNHANQNPLLLRSGIAHWGALAITIDTPHTHLTQRSHDFLLRLLDAFAPAGVHDHTLNMTWPKPPAHLRDLWETALTRSALRLVDNGATTDVVVENADGTKTCFSQALAHHERRDAATIALDSQRLFGQVNRPTCLLIDTRPVLRVSRKGQDMTLLERIDSATRPDELRRIIPVHTRMFDVLNIHQTA